MFNDIFFSITKFSEEEKKHDVGEVQFELSWVLYVF